MTEQTEILKAIHNEQKEQTQYLKDIHFVLSVWFAGFVLTLLYALYTLLG